MLKKYNTRNQMHHQISSLRINDYQLFQGLPNPAHTRANSSIDVVLVSVTKGVIYDCQTSMLEFF